MLLGPGSNAAAPHPVWSFCAARLLALACIFARCLAHFLACVCRITLPCHSLSNHHLFLDPTAGEPRTDASGKRLIKRVWRRETRFFDLHVLPIRMRRLRCCGSKVLMHFSRRFFIVFFAFLASAAILRSAAAAQAFIIVDAQTGYIFEEQEPRKKLQIGSLTKIATASVVLDWAERKAGDLNQAVTIPQEAFAGTLENNIGLQPGDSITLRDLLYAALVQSDNIAAYTLAHHVGSQLGSLVPSDAASKLTPVDTFVAQMNALAKQLKMERTRFVNPHGIDYKVKPLPYSTAEDMARLTRYAMNKALFRLHEPGKDRQISFNRAGHQLNYMLRNTNELLGKMGIDGVKTGTSARSGQCLILYANRESEVVRQGQQETVYPRHLMVVLLGSTNRFGEGTALLQRGWQLYDQWAAAGRLADPKKLL